MKQISIAILLCLCTLAGFAQGGQPLDLKDIVSGKFRAENIYGVIPIPGDGEHYSQMNAEGTQIIKYSFKTGEKVEVIFDVNTTRECDFKNFDSYQFSPDGQKLLIATKTTPIYRHSYTAVHYIYPLKRNDKGVTTNNIIERLSDGGPQQVPVFSPDGTMIAFVRNNNIFLVKLLYGNSESQITEDGKQNSVINGIPDWVYEEEFGFDRALEFSADNTLIAFIRFDESEVPSYSFPVFAGQAPRIDALKDYPGEYTYKYPKAGYPNSKVEVRTYDIKSHVTRTMKLPLDPDGYIPRIRFTKDANKLVEEFMLLANRTVAEKIGRVPKNKKPKVFPYRIHDLPDPEKLDNLSQFIARFGYKLRTSGTKTDVSKSINHLLDDIQGKKEENLIETVSIRAMQKARYSVHNIGHYGLAFDYYTHFTSPIRRYPDMMVHRLLTKYLDLGGRSVSEQKYEALCEHSSGMEQIAANAERASIKYKQVEYMTERLGQTYDGVISGVTEWGLYVELNENKCEGMIPIRDLDDDYYEFDEKNYCLRGRRKKRTYSLGDAITIKVARANLEKKQLDFALIE